MSKEIETLSFDANPNDPNNYLITVNEGPYKDVVFHFGRVWIDGVDEQGDQLDPNVEPRLHFEYDIDATPLRFKLDAVPDAWRADFQKFAGECLTHIMKKAMDEGSTVYANGAGGQLDAD